MRATRWIATIATVTFTVAGCATTPHTVTPGTTGTGLPRLQLHTGAAGKGDMGVPTFAPGEMMRPVWKVHYRWSGVGAQLPATATVWQLALPKDTPARVAQVAAALGVPGPVMARPVRDGGGWMVGDPSGASAGLSVSGDPAGSWWYSSAMATVGSGCAIAVDVATRPAPGGPATPVASAKPASDTVQANGTIPVDGTVPPPDSIHEPITPPCAPPAPPAGVPDSATARQMAQQLFAAAGFDLGSFAVTSIGDPYGASVTATLQIDGQPSPLTLSVSYGAGAAVTSMSGFLAVPTALGDYPLVDVATAVERANDPSMFWRGGGFGPIAYAASSVAGDAIAPTPAPPVAAADTAPGTDVAPTPLPATAAPVTVCTSAMVDCTSAPELTQPPPTEMDLVSVAMATVLFNGPAATLLLVPGYTFSSADGSTVTVAAVTDDVVDRSTDTATTDTPLPVAGGGSAAGGGIAGGAAAPTTIDGRNDPERLTVAKVLVGLDVATATERAASYHWTLRVVTRDGVSLPVTADMNPDRVDVAVTAGTVSSIVEFG